MKKEGSKNGEKDLETNYSQPDPNSGSQPPSKDCGSRTKGLWSHHFVQHGADPILHEGRTVARGALRRRREKQLPGVGFRCGSTRPWEESVQLLERVVAE